MFRKAAEIIMGVGMAGILGYGIHAEYKNNLFLASGHKRSKYIHLRASINTSVAKINAQHREIDNPVPYDKVIGAIDLASFIGDCDGNAECKRVFKVLDSVRCGQFTVEKKVLAQGICISPVYKENMNLSVVEGPFAGTNSMSLYTYSGNPPAFEVRATFAPRSNGELGLDAFIS